MIVLTFPRNRSGVESPWESALCSQDYRRPSSDRAASRMSPYRTIAAAGLVACHLESANNRERRGSGVPSRRCPAQGDPSLETPAQQAEHERDTAVRQCRCRSACPVGVPCRFADLRQIGTRVDGDIPAAAGSSALPPRAAGRKMAREYAPSTPRRSDVERWHRSTRRRLRSRPSDDRLATGPSP